MLKRYLQIVKLLTRFIVSFFALWLSKKKVRSCLVQAHFLHAGGTRTYFFSLVEFLSTHGYEVIVVMASWQVDEDIRGLQKQFPFIIEFKDVSVRQYRFTDNIWSTYNLTHLVKEMKLLIPLWGLMRRYRCASCIISEATPELWLFIFISPVKVFYTLHSVPLVKLDAIKKHILNACLGTNKKLITVSAFSKTMIAKNWTTAGNENNIEVLYNYYEPTHIPARREYNSKNILTIGTVDFYKNPLFWIDVCKEVSDRYKAKINFLWAGDGHLLQECKTLCKDYPYIQFLGVQKNVEQLYADCDVYFQPSLLESHGIAVLGAMCFEKPCVVSDKQGLPESVVDGETGFIVQITGLEEAIAAILSLLSDGTLALRLGKNGKKRFDDLFTKTTWTRRMKELYKLPA